MKTVYRSQLIGVGDVAGSSLAELAEKIETAHKHRESDKSQCADGRCSAVVELHAAEGEDHRLGDECRLAIIPLHSGLDGEAGRSYLKDLMAELRDASGKMSIRNLCDRAEGPKLTAIERDEASSGSGAEVPGPEADQPLLLWDADVDLADTGPLHTFADLQKEAKEKEPSTGTRPGRVTVYVPHTRLSVAISGGGVRATAFGLGGLLYLADKGLNQRVRSISSVSGGSFVNAVLAADHKPFSKLGKEEFRDRARAMIKELAGRRGPYFRTLGALAVLTVALVVALLWIRAHFELSSSILVKPERSLINAAVIDRWLWQLIAIGIFTAAGVALAFYGRRSRGFLWGYASWWLYLLGLAVLGIFAVTSFLTLRQYEGQPEFGMELTAWLFLLFVLVWFVLLQLRNNVAGVVYGHAIAKLVSSSTPAPAGSPLKGGAKDQPEEGPEEGDPSGDRERSANDRTVLAKKRLADITGPSLGEMLYQPIKCPTRHVFCATEMHAGQHAFFTHDIVYSQGFGIGTPGDLRLRTAVQASSNLPLAFPVRVLKPGQHGFKYGDRKRRTVRTMLLTDGGVFDNLADTWDVGMQDRINELRGRLPDTQRVGQRTTEYRLDKTIDDYSRLMGLEMTKGKTLIVFNGAPSVRWAESKFGIGLQSLVPVLTEATGVTKTMQVFYNNTTLTRSRDLIARFHENNPHGTLVSIEEAPQRVPTKGVNPDRELQSIHRARAKTAHTWLKAVADAPMPIPTRKWLFKKETSQAETFAAANKTIPTFIWPMGPERVFNLVLHAYLSTMLNTYVILGLPTDVNDGAEEPARLDEATRKRLREESKKKVELKRDEKRGVGRELKTRYQDEYLRIQRDIASLFDGRESVVLNDFIARQAEGLSKEQALVAGPGTSEDESGV